jgi:hypothetical protein
MSPQINFRELADFMAASGQRRRTLINGCRFRPIAPLMQHREAKLAIGKYLRASSPRVEDLLSAAEELDGRLADTDFERNTFDVNADYLRRFGQIADRMVLPHAEIQKAGVTPALILNGVKVTVEFALRLQRVTRSNKLRVGALALRYSKGHPVKDEAAAWQAAFIHGYLQETQPEMLQPEGKLCLVLDGWTGRFHEAPSNAVSRFKNMKAELSTIAEWWPNIAPPAGAKL